MCCSQWQASLKPIKDQSECWANIHFTLVYIVIGTGPGPNGFFGMGIMAPVASMLPMPMFYHHATAVQQF